MYVCEYGLLLTALVNMFTALHNSCWSFITETEYTQTDKYQHWHQCSTYRTAGEIADDAPLKHNA